MSSLGVGHGQMTRSAAVCRAARRWCMPAGGDALAVVVLCAVNVWIARPLFRIEYLVHTGSIEYAFIAIAERVRAAWPRYTWCPEWYGGVPFQNSYPPLLHFAVAAFASVSGLSSARAYHVVVSVFYCLVPLALYVFARVAAAPVAQSFLAGWFASVLSPSVWLLDGFALAPLDGGYARRFVDTVYWGEGPHTAAVALLPLALGALHLGVRDRRWTLPAAACLASVVLSNWLGGFGLAVAALAYSWSAPDSRKVVVRTLVVGALAYGLAGTMVPPSTIRTIHHNAQRVGGKFPVSGLNVACLAGVFALSAGLSRLSSRPLRRFAIGYAAVMTSIPLLARHGRFALVPQPERYHTEMELALCLLLALSLPPRRWVVAAAMLATLYPALRCAEVARRITKPIDIRRTSEFRVAKWFDEHMQGRRVWAPGSISFAMNVWTDTPQIGGGFDQGRTNRVLPAFQYQLLSGENAGERAGDVAMDWLKALGVHAVAVSSTGSTEAFKPMNNPRKFVGKAELLWDAGGDRIYRVAQRSRSLARAIPRSVVLRAAPTAANDTAALHSYLAACDDPRMPEMTWRWLGRDQAVVRGVLARDHAVSIQIAHHAGWTARSNGAPCGIEADGLGQLVVFPNEEGACVIELAYDGGLEMRLMKLFFWISLVVGLRLSVGR